LAKLVESRTFGRIKRLDDGSSGYSCYGNFFTKSRYREYSCARKA